MLFRSGGFSGLKSARSNLSLGSSQSDHAEVMRHDTQPTEERQETDQLNQPAPLEVDSGRNGDGGLSGSNGSIHKQSDFDFGSSQAQGSVVEL